MKLYTAFLLSSLAIFLVACGGSSSSQQTDSDTLQEIDTEVLKISTLKIDDLEVQVHAGTYKYVTSTLSSFNTMSQKMTDILDANTKTLDESLKLLETLAKAFEIDSNYSSTFATQVGYNATVPAFTIPGILSDKYLIVSSSNKFYTDGTTIKKYFFDTSSLIAGWTQIISASDKNKDLYIRILKLNNDNTLDRITNSFIIKSSELLTF